MRLVVLYGSQTGTAQDVAEHIWRESKLYGFSGPVLPMDEYDIQNLVDEKLCIIVVATTGNGDEPDNMKKAWKFLLRKSLPKNSLLGLQFACLGLGDSSYAKFNFTAKKLNKRLLQLGASNIIPIGLCDDQHDHGLGAVAMPWIAQLWKELQNRLPYVPKSPKLETVFKWNVNLLEKADNLVDLAKLKWPLPEEFHSFTLLENKRTTSDDHFQDVRFLKFQFPSHVNWQPGDIFNVRPCNSDQQVKTFLDLVKEYRLAFDENTIIQLKSNYEDMPLPVAYEQPVTVGLLAKYIWDLSAKPRQRAFELLALNCEDELEKEKLLEFTTSEGLDSLIQYINRPRRTILEVLQDFRHATSKLPLHILCELFTTIQPRSFSIASIPSSGTLDLLVAIVEYKTKLSVPRLGLCSNWMKDLKPGQTVLGSIKPGTMLIPKNPETPLIMIGPGTGIAPFRSVIQHRSEQNENVRSNEDIVYFGCRNKNKDYHFKEDFKRWQDSKVVKLFVAFSRDQENKIYVQHLVRENKELLRCLIKEEGAVVLVAGSSKNMPIEVKDALTYVLEDDKDYVEQMFKNKRYQEETWS